jgi:hypothetical protein
MTVSAAKTRAVARNKSEAEYTQGVLNVVGLLFLSKYLSMCPPLSTERR